MTEEIQEREKQSRIINDMRRTNPIKKQEIFKMISGKADKTELYNSLKSKVGKIDIMKQQELIACIHNYLKHVVVFSHEILRDKLKQNNATENEQISNEAHLLSQIQNIFKWVCKLDKKLKNPLEVKEINSNIVKVHPLKMKNLKLPRRASMNYIKDEK